MRRPIRANRSTQLLSIVLSLHMKLASDVVGASALVSDRGDDTGKVYEVQDPTLIKLSDCNWFGEAPNCDGACPTDFIHISSSSKANPKDTAGSDNDLSKAAEEADFVHAVPFGKDCARGEKHFCCKAKLSLDDINGVSSGTSEDLEGVILDYVVDVESSLPEFGGTKE